MWYDVKFVEYQGSVKSGVYTVKRKGTYHDSRWRHLIYDVRVWESNISCTRKCIIHARNDTMERVKLARMKVAISQQQLPAMVADIVLKQEALI